MTYLSFDTKFTCFFHNAVTIGIVRYADL